MKILESASKIVFILMAVGVNVAMFIGKIDAEQYMMLAGMAFTFYFANKGDGNAQVGGTAYLGK